MKPLDELEHFPPLEKMVNILTQKSQNSNPKFFRILVAFYFSQVASMMRCNVDTKDRGIIPINTYAINLSSSGSGKGLSTNIMEIDVMGGFRDIFLEQTLPAVADKNIARVANKRSIKKASDPDIELELVQAEYEALGAFPFSYDSGTTPAFKQLRYKCLLGNIGSTNLIIDEAGSNLLGNAELLTTYLEAFDQGLVKQKLIKNTKENTRGEDLSGKVPANMLLFGTPSKMLNGLKVEDEFFSMLETGYARRCLFGYSRHVLKSSKLSPEEVYDILTNQDSSDYINELSDKMRKLADISNFGINILVSKQVSLLLIEYRLHCEHLAEDLPEHEDIKKSELIHRYFKTLKLAGAFAFIDGMHDVQERHIYNAIKLVEESGEAFNKIIKRPRAHQRLAEYLGTIGREVTAVDLTEDLPFYKGSEPAKREMMTLAKAYGYKNNISITSTLSEDIEFFKGSMLKETELDKMTISYSTDITTGYRNERVPFDQLHKLCQSSKHHWVSHYLSDGYRDDAHCIAGFNLAVIDVDGEISIDTAKLLLKEYKFLIYTTKRHTDKINRFRLVFPMSHNLELDQSTFKVFMQNIYDWLPFNSDTQTNQRSRKWLTNKGHYEYNDGELLNALLFIPKTTEAEKRKKIIMDSKSMSNLQRWFLTHASTGSRNNDLAKFAFMLVDSGLDIDTVRSKVLDLNSKLVNPLTETEVLTSVIFSASKKIAERDIKNAK